jgi:hypothetical protein
MVASGVGIPSPKEHVVSCCLINVTLRRFQKAIELLASNPQLFDCECQRFVRRNSGDGHERQGSEREKYSRRSNIWERNRDDSTISPMVRKDAAQ